MNAYHRTYGLPVTISNSSNNFGPYQFPEKFIPLAITNALEDKPIPVYGQGDQVRDWLFVVDHCRGVELVIQKGKIGETYLFGGLTADISNLEVAKLILKKMNKPEILIKFVTDRPGHDVRYAIDWTYAAKTLGFRPQADFETYLEKTIDWYLQNQSWWQRVKSGEYQKYYKKQYHDRINNSR